VTAWEQRAKGSAEWAAAGNLVVLGHALLVSVKLLCVLDLAHRLNGALSSSSSTASASARTGALELTRLSMQLLEGDGEHHEKNKDLSSQLAQLQLSGG
jgi:hypothetical protein